MTICIFIYIYISYLSLFIYMFIDICSFHGAMHFAKQQTSPASRDSQVWNAFKELQHVGALDRAGTKSRGLLESGGVDFEIWGILQMGF